MNTKCWTQRDGTKIRIKDMGDQHLLNTIAMLERNAQNRRDQELNAAYSVSATLSGEMASFCCDQDIDSMEQDADGEMFLHPLYDEMVEEAARRKIGTESP